jgi:protein-S-isoprenylcysteine O-methyltransferase Ste14
MKATALVIYGLFAFAALIVRSVLHVRATGRSPILVPSTPLAWLGQASVTAGLFASPVGVVFGNDDGGPRNVVGLSLLVLGVLGVIVAQAQMGKSWRAGVDPAERTELVTHGLFRRMRNPIYSSMIVAGAGMALVVSNAVTVVSAVAILAGSEILVRRVEEPYLRSTHGEVYEEYVARSGRFVPLLSGARRARR